MFHSLIHLNLKLDENLIELPFYANGNVGYAVLFVSRRIAGRI